MIILFYKYMNIQFFKRVHTSAAAKKKRQAMITLMMKISLSQLCVAKTILP